MAKLSPFSTALFKLHLNYAAILTPKPPYLRNCTIMGVFGVMTGFFLADWTH